MVPLSKPYFDLDDISAVVETMKSGWVAQGPKCEELEELVAKYLNCNHVISVSNCTSALYLALKACGIGKGDEVIVPDFTFPATALAVVHTGAKPVFVDSEILTYNIDPLLVEQKITEKTKAIIPVHLFGQSAQMWKIIEIAEKYSLRIIEDAACSLGANHWGDKVGTLGDIGCFSLHARKGITTGEGGLICTDDSEFAEFIKKASNFGVERTYGRKTEPVFDFPGFNFKMSDITAAIGIAQLRKIEKRISLKIKAARKWEEIISTDMFLKNEVITPVIMKDNAHIFQSYVIRVSQNKVQEVFNYFKRLGYQTGIGTYACHMHPIFKDKDENFPVSTSLYHSLISLPI